MAGAISYSQSASGQIITFIDETVLSAPITNYVRTVEVYSGKDATGTLLDTLTFVDSDLTVDFAITADAYFSAKLIYVGSPTVTSATINFVTRRFELNLLINKNAKNCGGCGKKNCDPKFEGFIDYYLANEATKIGNSGAANLFISSSYKWLNR